MKIEDAALIMKGYERLRKQVDELARTKLKEQYDSATVKVKTGGGHLRYLNLISIYVENGYIVASYDYNEPYSDHEEVIIQASELG